MPLNNVPMAPTRLQSNEHITIRITYTFLIQFSVIPGNAMPDAHYASAINQVFTRTDLLLHIRSPRDYVGRAVRACCTSLVRWMALQCAKRTARRLALQCAALKRHARRLALQCASVRESHCAQATGRPV